MEGLLEKFRSKHDKKNVEANYASQVAHALAKTIESSATTMEDECPICLDHPLIEETVITPCAHVFCRECLVGILERNGDDKEKNAESSSTQCPNGICPSCNEPIDAKRIITLSKSSEEGDRVTTSYLHGSPPKNASVAAKEESTMDSSHLAARQTLEKALRGAGSSKLTAVIRELHNVWEKDPRSKVLIFSQYLGFLDLLEVALAKNGIPSGRFDGKLSLKERVAVLDKFRQEVHPMEDDADADDRSSRIGSVLLMSMKAGGVGINMVAASTGTFSVARHTLLRISSSIHSLNAFFRPSFPHSIVTQHLFVIRGTMKRVKISAFLVFIVLVKKLKSSEFASLLYVTLWKSESFCYNNAKRTWHPTY